uniref:Uncharacterized protein n=1 Tax=viral metagenome TaxID=1070528 RepID=A0A6M3JEA1_9ZZZZ
MNGYVGFYRGKRFEVHADTSLQAQEEIARKYKIKKAYEITIVLAEKGHEQVTHLPLF